MLADVAKAPLALEAIRRIDTIFAIEREMNGLPEVERLAQFAGSDRGGERAATIYTLIETAKLNNVDPQAWLENVLRRIADHPASRLSLIHI